MNNCLYVRKLRMHVMAKEKLECEERQIHEDVIARIKADMLSVETGNELSALFKMFADPTRLKILGMLFKEELCVCDIAFLLDMTHSAVSHQLSVLRQNRLIKYRRSGKNVFYSLDDAHIQQIYDAGLAHILEH